MKNREVKEDIISKRYINDGFILVNLDNIQKKYLNLFLNDNRIKYKTIFECPLCKSEKAILVAEKERYGISLETVVCENCGLIRSYRQLDEESTKMFYSEYYREIQESLNKTEFRYKAGTERKIPKYITKDKVILEIGCGGGWNLMPFRNNEHYGFDFDRDFIEHGKKKGLNLYLGGVEEAIRMKIKCDYLLLDQVLEHAPNPVDFLTSLKPLLNEGAIINIYVPSLNLLWWGYANYDLLRTLQNAHNFLFDEFTLRAIGKITGFKVLNCFANNLVLKNFQNGNDSSLDLSDLNRGERIVSYLKFSERLLSFRKKIGLDKFSFKKFYYLLRPIRCYKKFCMDFLGKI